MHKMALKNRFIKRQGLANEDTLWRQHCWLDHVSQMLTRFATRATFVADTNFLSWTQQNVSESLRNISCVRAARNNVAAFLPRTGNIAGHNVTATMCPRFAGASCRSLNISSDAALLHRAPCSHARSRWDGKVTLSACRSRARTVGSSCTRPLDRSPARKLVPSSAWPLVLSSARSLDCSTALSLVLSSARLLDRPSSRRLIRSTALSLVLSSARSLGRSFARPLILSSARSLGRSFARPLVLSSARSLGRSFARPLVLSSARSLGRSFARPLILSSARSLVLSTPPSLGPSFARPLVGSFAQPLVLLSARSLGRSSSRRLDRSSARRSSSRRLVPLPIVRASSRRLVRSAARPLVGLFTRPIVGSSAVSFGRSSALRFNRLFFVCSCVWSFVHSFVQLLVLYLLVVHVICGVTIIGPTRWKANLNLNLRFHLISYVLLRWTEVQGRCGVHHRFLGQYFQK